MNSTSFPSATQSLLNSSNTSSLPSQVLFKFNTTHISTRPRNITQFTTRPRKITTKVSASAAPSLISAPEKETLYDLLGISENVTLSEIKHAYKKMALKYHPDVSPPDRVEEYTMKFIRVQEAYETLSDPEARFMYDNCMANGFAFSGKRETRFDTRPDDKKRWKETWVGQISELQRRSTRSSNRGMSWAARIRKQRSESCVNGSDSAQ
ncbi:putative DnaJ domain, Chaperone J-domain superfamily [Helianthus annuus]|uniref:DnaJ domain, Chaperone J-domain superfamily n=1 Tax=Helianthus annuus TaxID=4232 RepID=A0A251UGM7_HELAN|nr:chaperone protein dnaJ 20, chloroplastic [Helianthus annuus]KAF5801551.1 putative DnaJ domain, Chaperone J-domain superfamily [Helianthus annuus]KAJ0559841.1 putative DnaJ domain, Chaperone J-domain superfamily [Helianthus annuus]KAJ0565959.1 putative DnaJ domain, Chaperone J-domain superfamily [Helianthus annuus]KAJ0572821.1 putative DnaJ domain, Chaperone J-domain superfamily [Helianthus annuus]KAJ0737252.1 putative DnaJ domain, Chaperone J-domain superfamily [Helianthus annuus]